MATMEEMQEDLDALKEYVLRQGDEILKLKKNKRIEDEENCSLESESELSQRLYDIEFQLSEQKRSTTKITKLCMAAIKALEKLEQKPGGLEVGNFDESSTTSKDSDSSVDPQVIKTLCEQMDVINKLLIKVDDDIEAVDQKAEDGLSDCEKITDKIKEMEKAHKDRCDTLLGEMRALLVSKTYATREDLSRSIKTIPTPISKEEIGQMITNVNKEISQSIKSMPIPMKKEEVTQMITKANAEVSQSVKAMPIPMKKEEIAQMIDRATSNFLRTVQAETANCMEKTQDCEEFVKSELEKLKKSVEETDNFVRNEARQIQEKTEKNMKEVTRTLANLVEQQQTKSNSQNVDAYEKLNKRIDIEIKNFSEMIKDIPKEENKGIDEIKFNARMERLGKEISLMKAKQTEFSQNFENSQSKQTFLETQNNNISRTLEKHQDEVQKVTMVERNLDELSQKIEANSKLYENAIEECHKKIDKTEMDDLRNGMEKERCKINYFQDKISNIAKSVEGVKIENNNMRDKFCADIESHDLSIKSIEKLIEKQATTITENSNALKGITNDSIGKIKDVANNCVQVEMNIRSIRDKSILFDNDLKQIKDQITQIKHENTNQQQTFEKDILKIVKQKDDDVKAVHEGIQNIKKKVQSNTTDLNNFKEDKRTKEGENEERQLSLEQNLSDVRGYMETMLNETNKQVANIAIEVENANVKISKCASDIGEVFYKHANHTGDFTFVIQNLEEKMKDLQEYGNIKQAEYLEKILELRTSFVDSQSEFVDKLKLSNESIAKLREESSMKIKKLETQMNKDLEINKVNISKNIQNINDNKNKTQSDINDIIGKLDSFKAGHESAKAEMEKCIEEGRVNYSKVTDDILCLQKAKESNQNALKNVQESLSKVDKDVKGKGKEDHDKVVNLKSDLEKSKKNEDSLKKEIDIRMENLRKNLVEMIGLNELKTSEIDDNLKQTKEIVNDIKVVQNNMQMNIENKLKATKDNFESVMNDSLNTKNCTSDEIETKLSALKKELDHLKNDFKIGDLESFKNVVNHTTETHNKLISSMQKNIDLIICEKTILESQTAVLDSRVTDMLSEKDVFENSTREAIDRECEESEKVKEQVQNLQVNIRDINDKIEACTKLDSNFNSLSSSIQETKNDLTAKIQENSSKANLLKEILNGELKNLKASVTSSGQTLTEKLKEFNEVSNNIQEKSLLADTKLNEALEIINNHTRVIDNLSDSIGQVSKTSETSDSQVQKLELKLTSCIEELSRLDEFVTSSDFKKLERSLNEKSDKSEADEADKKFETLKQDISNSIHDLTGKNKSLEHMLKDFQSKISDLPDVTGIPDEIQMLSSKVNQQKAKLIDMEANITMQERSTTKLSDDVKKLNGTISGNMNKIDQINKSNNSSENNLVKMSNVSKQNDMIADELKALSEMKATFDSKTSLWDRKADSADIDKLNKIITEEVNKIQKEIKDIMKYNEENKTNLKNMKEDGDQNKIMKTIEQNFIRKEDLKTLDIKFSKLSDQVEKTSSTLNTNMDKLGSKISSLESSKQETTTKISEVIRKNDKLNGEINNLSGFQSKFESKVEYWDSKADPGKIMNKVIQLVNDEVKKVKQDIDHTLEKNDEKSTNQENKVDQNTMLKDLEKKFINKEEFKTVDQKLSKLTSEIEKTNGNISRLEKNTIECDSLRNDASTKLTDLSKRNDKLIEEVNILSGFKSKLDSKMNIWDSKTDHTDFKNLDTYVNEETNKLKRDIQFILDKNDEISANLKNSSNPKEETISKTLENKLTNSIAQFDNKIATFQTFRKETETKLPELFKKCDKIEEDLRALSNLKSDFDSKVSVWNNKADPAEIRKLDSFVNEEMKKLKKDIDYILEKNDEISANVKNSSNQNQETISKTLENKLTNSVAQFDNKIATFQTFRKETETKLPELLKKCDKIDEDLRALSSLKSDFDSKVSVWNSKADPAEIRKLDSFVNEELKKIKKDVNYVLEKNDELGETFKSITKGEDQESISKKLENRLTGNIAQIENKMATFEAARQDTSKNISQLVKTCEQINGDLSNISGLKAQFDSKTSLWDSKVDPTEVKQLNTFVNEEMKKLKKDNEYVLGKIDEINNNIKYSVKSEEQETISKSLENRLTSNIAQMENKMATFDASRQDTSSKLSELMSKSAQSSKDLAELSELKSKFDSKVSLWDNKVDPFEMKKLETFVNEEVKKIKKDIEYILEKNDEISINLKNKEKLENEETTSKSLESKLNTNIAQIENKIAIFESSRKDNTTKISDLTKKYETINSDLKNIHDINSKFESKVSTWDSKVDSAEVKKLNTSVNEDIKKMKNDIEYVLGKYDEIGANLSNASKNETQESVSKSLENKLMGSIAQIENKIAIFESSRQEATQKMSELSKQNDKLNENFVNISGFKSNIESKVSGWDRKANSEDVSKLNSFVNEEVTQIKKNIQNIQNKNDELNENLKNTSQSCNEATLSKNLENRFVCKEEYTTLESSLSQLSNEMKNSKQNQTSDTIIKNIEEKVSKLQNGNSDLNNKFENLVEKSSQINDEVAALSRFKSKLNPKENIWDSKVDVSEIDKINELVKDEVKKLQSNIDSIVEKNEEVQKNFKSTKQNESLESSLNKIEGNFITKNQFLVLEKNHHTLTDDVRKINSSISEHIKKVDDKMSKFDISNSDLGGKYSELYKKNEHFSSELKQFSDIKSQFNSKAKIWDTKADQAEIKRLDTLINDEIKKVQKNIDNILEKNEKMLKKLENKSQDNNQEDSYKDIVQRFITKEEFTVLDINFSKLSEIVESVQDNISRDQNEGTKQLEKLESSMKTLKTQVEAMTKDSKYSEPSSTSSNGITELVKTIQVTIGSLETSMNSLKADVPTRKEFEKIQNVVEDNRVNIDRGQGHGYENALTSIDKQRRGWEEAKEKAEEMSQIFDSLIITNDRPYVSCGLDVDVTEPGLLEFSQFELINKFGFDTDTNQFTLLEPGVYLLQMAGTVQGGNLVAKLVSEDIAVDFMTLEGGKNGAFKSRSTIFTIEDDDQAAESLLVELVGEGGVQCRLDRDFSFLMYKISEVSNGEQLE